MAIHVDEAALNDLKNAMQTAGEGYKKNNGNTEETIMFLTEENKIASLKKEIEENKKKEKNENIKKVKKEEEFIPLEEDKINLLFEILNQEDNSINEEIWKLLGSIKYPDNLINKATSEELMNVIVCGFSTQPPIAVSTTPLVET